LKFEIVTQHYSRLMFDVLMLQWSSIGWGWCTFRAVAVSQMSLSTGY